MYSSTHIDEFLVNLLMRRLTWSATKNEIDRVAQNDVDLESLKKSVASFKSFECWGGLDSRSVESISTSTLLRVRLLQLNFLDWEYGDSYGYGIRFSYERADGNSEELEARDAKDDLSETDWADNFPPNFMQRYNSVNGWTIEELELSPWLRLLTAIDDYERRRKDSLIGLWFFFGVVLIVAIYLNLNSS